MEVHFIDVGNADCTLVRQGDFCVLIDAGERGDRNRILQYLNDAGVRRLDLVIATHAHADHIGSMAAVLESIPTERMLLAYMAPEDTPTSATYIDMLEVLDEKSIPVEEAVPGAVYTVAGAGSHRNEQRLQRHVGGHSFNFWQDGLFVCRGCRGRRGKGYPE